MIALLIVLLAGALVAGCGSEDAPSPTPSTRPPASGDGPPQGPTTGPPLGAQPAGRILGREGAERRRKQLARLGEQCERIGTQRQRISALARFADGRVLRIGYRGSGSFPPCKVKLVATSHGVQVTLWRLDPRIATADLREWCAEVEPAAPIPARTPFIDIGRRHPGEIRPGDPASWREWLRAPDEGCVWLDGTPVYPRL
jgi:hypothetical protein